MAWAAAALCNCVIIAHQKALPFQVPKIVGLSGACVEGGASNQTPRMNVLGYAAALATFATFWMRTMIALRVVGIAANCLFISYGYLAELYPVLGLHLMLLPLNILRLIQMIQLVSKVQEASSGNAPRFGE